jgi:hypothetical protein
MTAETVDRGKRLSRSNVIGEQGELAFQQWALKRQLSANKAHIDVGIDFFCQVMSPVPGSTSLEAVGSILGAQVKTVDENENPSLKLDRIDAIDLLRQNQPTCVFGLRLSDGSVRFQFLNIEFMDRLLKFLDTDRESVSISYADLSGDPALFERLLGKYSNAFEQLQLRIHLIKKRMTKAIPGADLSIQSTGVGTKSRIYVPTVSSAFLVDEGAREKIRLKMLREGTIDPLEDGVNLHPAVLNAIRETQSSLVELAAQSGKRVTVGIRWRDKYASEPFERYAYDSEIAFVHRAGLRLTWDTKRENVSGVYMHATESELFKPKRRASLKGSPLIFFRLFQAGAALYFESDTPMPLSAFGSRFESFGNALAPVPDLCTALGLPFSQVALADFNDEEFSISVWFLEELLLKGTSVTKMVNGFVLGAAAEIKPELLPTVPIRATIPIVLNWKKTGIVVWIECDAEAYKYKGLMCGLRITRQLSWKVEKRKRFSKSVHPEMCVARDWPTIEIGADLGERTWTFDPTKSLPVEALITRIDVQDSEPLTEL